MTPQGKKLSALFALLQGAFWSAYCMFYAFLINILTEYGFPTFLSGLTLTLISLATIFVQPMLGYISDTFITVKKLLLICFSIAAVLTVFLPKLMTGNHWVAIGAIVLLSIFDYSIYTVIDVWAVRTIADNPGMEFAVVRSGGSIFYAVTALIMGEVVLLVGVNILFIGHVVMLLACIAAAFFLKDYPCPNSRKYPGSDLVNAPAGDSLGSAMKQLFTNKKYVIAVVTLAIFQLSSRITQSYIAVVIESFGGNSGNMGLALFIGSSLEIVVMIAIGRMISNGGSLTYMYLAFNVIMAMRFALLLIPGGVWVPVLTQAVQALAIGTYLRVFPDYISDITPKHLTATACTFAIALSMGGGSVPGNLLGGWVIENAGMQAYIIVSVVIGLIGAVVFLPNVIEEYNTRKAAKAQ